MIQNHGFAQHARGKLNSIHNLEKNGFHFFVIFNKEKRRKTTCSPTWRDIFMGTWAPTSFAELFCSFLLSKSSEKFSNVPSSDKCIKEFLKCDPKKSREKRARRGASARVYIFFSPPQAKKFFGGPSALAALEGWDRDREPAEGRPSTTSGRPSAGSRSRSHLKQQYGKH